jgi:hypothetical protein
MVHLLAAMTSFVLIVFGMGLVAHTLRKSGAAVLSALSGQALFNPVPSTPRVRRAVRFRTLSVTQPVAASPHCRAAA